jgi:hypothetical protein
MARRFPPRVLRRRTARIAALVAVVVAACLAGVLITFGRSPGPGRTPPHAAPPARAVSGPPANREPTSTGPSQQAEAPVQAGSGGLAGCGAPAALNRASHAPSGPRCSTASGERFGIAGGPDQPLYPGGPAELLDLAIENPYGFAIEITGISVTLESSSARACPPSENFRVVRGFGGTVTIRARTTETLTSAGAAPAQLPEIRMVDTGTNQDACQDAAIRLLYAGQAQRAPRTDPPSTAGLSGRPE